MWEILGIAVSAAAIIFGLGLASSNRMRQRKEFSSVRDETAAAIASRIRSVNPADLAARGNVADEYATSERNKSVTTGT